MNQCHLAKLYSATLFATAKAVFAQAPAHAIAEPALSTPIEMPVSAKVVAKTKEFFEKLKKTTKAEKYCDFTYADKKVWWSVQ